MRMSQAAMRVPVRASPALQWMAMAPLCWLQMPRNASIT